MRTNFTRRRGRLLEKKAESRRRLLRLEQFEERRVLATFIVTNTDPSGAGSLRQAILDANATANLGSPDQIEFDIPGAGPHTISLTSASGPLPDVSDAVDINGFSQPGASENTNPVGQPLNAVHQIQVDGSGDVANGIVLAGSGGSLVRGLALTNFAASGVVVLSSNNTIEGNNIGVAADGITQAGNTGDGISILDGSSNVVGGSGQSPNVIAHNTGTGVLVAPSSSGVPSQNSITGNSIFNNFQLGIDLSETLNGPDDVTINDPGDADTGANDLQNYPVLLSAISSSTETTVEAFFSSTPSSDFELHFYENTIGADPSGNGEGQIYLGSFPVTTAANGIVTFTVSGLPPTDGDSVLTATATNSAGSTSEFSSAVRILELSSISGYKFDDLNGDGDDESGADPRRNGVTILLRGDTNGDGNFDDVSESDTTGPNGEYAFSDLFPGRYIVSEIVPSDSVSTTAVATTFDVVENTSYTPSIVPELAFGNFQLFSISGTKFEDIDGDAVQDPGEPGLQDWTIFLDDNDNGILDPSEESQTTTFDGSYSFDDLGPGTYRVREVQQSGFTQTTPDPAAIVGVSGTDRTGIDFGNQEIPASIAGVKFEDVDGDGVRDVGEPGLQDWVIYLDLNGNGSLDSGEPNRTTASDGSYLFDPISPDTYLVREVQQSGFRQTTPDPVTVVAGPGDVITNVDFGNQALVSISGIKFEDIDGDGVRDPAEPGLPGWTIYLDLNNNGSLDPTEPQTTTISDGSYSFDDLIPGSYLVREIQQTGFRQTTPNPVVVDAPVSVAGVDIGNQQVPASISGIKFEDVNGNGMRDAGEGVLADFTIFLDDNENGELDSGERSTQTDVDGVYIFDNLDAGRYVVDEVQKSGFRQTFPFADFSSPNNFSSEGGWVTSLTQGDFDDDGFIDLASANDSTNEVQIFFGDGTGDFNATDEPIAVGVRPVSLTTFQLDGLIHLALLTGGNVSDPNGDEDQLSIMINQGDGTFAPPSGQLPAGNGAIDLAIGDVNNDDNDDAVVANFRDAQITILSAPDGGDLVTTEIPVGTGPVDVDFVRINEDEFNDLVVVNSGSDDVSILLGDGTGNFQTFTTLDVGSAPSAAVSGDVNGDGLLDLVVANYLSDTITIFFDVAGNAFETTVGVGSRPTDLTLANVTGDIGVEIIVANSESGSFTVVDIDSLNEISVSSSASGGGARAVTAADFNGDTFDDLAFATFQPHPSADFGSRVSIVTSAPTAHTIFVSDGEQVEDVDFGNQRIPDSGIPGPGGGVAPSPEEVTVAMDVSGDGRLSPTDALAVINFMGRSSGEPEDVGSNRRFDINADGQVSPIDALLIINELERRQSSDPSASQVSSQLDFLADSDSESELDRLLLEIAIGKLA